MTPVADIPHLFLANWADSVTVTTAYETRIDVSQTDTEGRRVLSERPTRTLRVRLSALGQDGLDLDRLQALINESTKNRVRVPLYSDSCRTTSATTSSNTLTVTATNNRRFFAGLKVFIATKSTPIRWSYQVATISSVSANSIVLTSNVTVPAGAKVYPSIVTEVVFGANKELASRWYGDLVLVLREVFSNETLPPLVAIGSTPPSTTVFNSIPVFTIPYAWKSVTTGGSRQGSLASVGLDSVPQLYGKTRFTLQADLLRLNRSDSAALQRFFDSRGGRAFPFWLPRPEANFAGVSITATAVTVQVAHTSLTTATALIGKHLALVRSNGQVSTHRITAVDSNAGNPRFAVTPAINLSTFGLSHLSRISLNELVRFDSDELAEEWITDEVMSASVTVRELPLGSSGVNGDGGLSGEGNGSPPVVPPLATGEDPLPSWTPSGTEDEATTVHVPMFFNPVETEASDRDPARPPIRAADFTMPRVVRLNLKDLSLDPLRSDVDLSAAIARLKGVWKLTYDAALDGTGKSRHWNHIRTKLFNIPGPVLLYDMDAGGVNVVRRVWRAFGQYEDGGDIFTLEVRLVTEWASTDSDGMWGTNFVVHVFTDQIPYVDGTPVTTFGSPNITFTRSDPAVSGLSESRSAEQKYCHPQLMLTGSVPTTWTSAARRVWGKSDTSLKQQTYADVGRYKPRRVKCDELTSGAPWEITERGVLWKDVIDEKQQRRWNLLGTSAFLPDATGLELVRSVPGWEFQGSNVGSIGSAWYRPTSIDVTAPWYVKFKYQFKDRVNDGEGFAFVLNPGGAQSLGTEGGGLGYGGISNTVSVEFDLRRSLPESDPVGPHISLQNGGTNHSLSLANTSFTPDDLEHEVEVFYSGGRVHVLVDGIEKINVVFSPIGKFGGSGTAYFGFTSSTSFNEYQTVYIRGVVAQVNALAYGSASLSPGNSTFGPVNGYAAIALGGGCPESRPFNWLVVENRPGLTLAKVARPGWDEDTSSLVWKAPSASLTIRKLQQAHPIDCCLGHSSAFVAGAYGCLNIDGCCFLLSSNFSLSLQTYAICTTSCVDSGGNPVSVASSRCGADSDSFNMFVETASYALGGLSTDRTIKWSMRKEDPDYISKGTESDFFAPGTSPFVMLRGGWVNSGGVARSSGSAAMLVSASPGGDSNIYDGQVVAVFAEKPVAPIGAVARGKSSGAGIVAVYEARYKTVSLRDYSNSTAFSTVAKQNYVSEALLNDNLRLHVFGTFITVEYSGSAPFTVEYCDSLLYGGFGAWGDGPVAFDSLAVADLSPDLTEVFVQYSDSPGWSFGCPENAREWYPRRHVDEETGSCVGKDPAVSCCTTTKVRYTVISGTEDGTNVTDTGAVATSMTPCPREPPSPIDKTEIGSGSTILCGTDITGGGCSGFTVWFKLCLA